MKEKKKKKKKTFVKVKDFKVRHWQHSNSQRKHPQHPLDPRCRKMRQNQKTSTERPFEGDEWIASL